MLLQQARDRVLPVRDRTLKRGLILIVAGARVSTVAKEDLDGLLVPESTGLVEWGPAMPVFRPHQLWPGFQDPLHPPRIITVGGPKECQPVSIGRIYQIIDRTMIDQSSADLLVPPLASEMDWIPISLPHPYPTLYQHLRCSEVPPVSGEHQRRPLSGFRRPFDIGTTIQEQTHDLILPPARRNMQWRETLGIPHCHHARIGIENRSDGIEITMKCWSKDRVVRHSAGCSHTARLASQKTTR